MLNKVDGIEFMITLLDRKIELLDEIFDLTKKQTKVIGDGKIDKLNELIRSKQLRIDKINKIDNEFSKIFKDIKQRNNINKIEELDVSREYLIQLKELTGKMYKIIENICDIEKNNNELIKQNLNMVKSKIKEINIGKKAAINYYGKSVQYGGYFIDKKK